MSISSIESTAAQYISVVGSSSTKESDERVRLRPKGGITKFAKDSPLLQPLLNTNGFMFPYRPIIETGGNVAYGTQELVHSIQDFNYFIRNSSTNFSMSGQFSCEDNDTAAYTFACIHFLRSISKMHFGGFSSASSTSTSSVASSLSSIASASSAITSATSLTGQSSGTTSSDSLVGAPPQVLILNGYGQYMFNNIPVLLRSFNLSFPDNIDYVKFTVNSVDVWLPVVLTISLSLTAQVTPEEARNFNYNDFKNGTLLKKGKWF